MAYFIVAFPGFDVPRAIKRRSDAAYLAFNRAVDDMVRSDAGLDTLAGVTAQRQARAATMPRIGGADVTVYYRDKMVICRAVKL